MTSFDDCLGKLTTRRSGRAAHVSARNPESGTVVRISNSKVVRTAGSATLGSNLNLVPISLCLDFIRSKCPAGTKCPSLHVLGMSSRGWPLISVDEAPVDGVTLYEEGWLLPCYDLAQSIQVDIPSQLVARTKGSAAYIVQYNEHGQSGRFRYRVCREYSATGQCANGGDCPMIHTRADLEAHTHSKVHVNFVVDDVTSSRYPTMQPGRMLRVSDPNIRTMVHEVPSEYVLQNCGSDSVVSGSRRRLTHCAHFYLKKVCNRGPDCTFLHVLTVIPQFDLAKKEGPTTHKPLDETELDGEVFYYCAPQHVMSTPMTVMIPKPSSPQPSIATTTDSPYSSTLDNDDDIDDNIDDETCGHGHPQKKNSLPLQSVVLGPAVCQETHSCSSSSSSSPSMAIPATTCFIHYPYSYHTVRQEVVVVKEVQHKLKK